MPPGLRYVCFGVLCFWLVACGTAAPTTLPTVAVLPSLTPDEDALCQQLIEDVTQTTDTACAGIGRNQACYGNTRLNVQPRPQITLPQFAAPGDLINITDIESLQLSPLNTQQREWGVAVLALQANLPDTLPGQNVLVFLFGDVQWGNVPQTQAYYLRTGIGDAPCKAAPESGILVQTPTGAAEIQLTINGVEIRLMSTAFIQAPVDAAMRVNVVEGQGIITAQNISRVVPAGTRTTIALTSDWLPAAPPTETEPYTAADFAVLPIEVLPREIEIAVFDETETLPEEVLATEEILATEEASATEEVPATEEVISETPVVFSDETLNFTRRILRGLVQEAFVDGITAMLAWLSDGRRPVATPVIPTIAVEVTVVSNPAVATRQATPTAAAPIAVIPAENPLPPVVLPVAPPAANFPDDHNNGGTDDGNSNDGRNDDDENSDDAERHDNDDDD